MQKSILKVTLKEESFVLERPRATMGEIVADKLREFILLEKLPPGAQIAERDVSEALGISRTPMRAALAILEQEGLVKYSVTRRPHVANPSISEIAQNLVVLGSLEALAGELACLNASDAEIQSVVELAQKMQAGSDSMEPLDFFRADMEMHRTIARASGNQPLIETHRQYNSRLWRARFLSSRRSKGREQTLAEHASIAKAAAARDAKATSASLRAHLDSAISNIKFALAEREQDEDKD